MQQVLCLQLKVQARLKRCQTREVWEALHRLSALFAQPPNLFIMNVIVGIFIEIKEKEKQKI